MELDGLHFMLNWQCIFECDHCFVWGGPQQSGVWRLDDLRQALDQAQNLGTVEWIYFEGGEPFLVYPLLLQAVAEARQRGFKVGIVTNAYWATDPHDAQDWLRSLAGQVDDFSISSDLYHYSEVLSRQAQNASQAAQAVGLPVGIIEIAQPQAGPEGSAGTLMYRGRAAVKLASQAARQPWAHFIHCPHENLRQPGRVHLDPFGNVHICQGICLGNIFETPLSEICAAYQPDNHPILGPLLHGGPAELARSYQVTLAAGYADACHLCYTARRSLRAEFPAILKPDGMYAG